MKKILFTLVSFASLLTFNGCNAVVDYDNGYVDTSNYRTNYSDSFTTLFLVDAQGFSYGNVPYKCDSMYEWSRTPSNGEFSFIEPDSCVFDFNGLDGTYGDEFDNIVRIVDYNNGGKGSIPYECSSFGVASTYTDGSFDYDTNDVCTFVL